MRALLGATLLVGLFGAGCRESSSSAVSAFAPELLDVQGGGAWVEPGLRRAVADARWLRTDATDEVPALPMTIALSQVEGADERPILRLHAHARTPAGARGQLGEVLETIVEVEAAEGSLELVRHGGLALERAVAVLDAKIGLALEGRAAVGLVLASDDPQIVVLGLDFVADGRLREHADTVAALVQHPDERVSLRAVECLGVVGDTRHVRAIVRLPRLSDRAYAHRIYDTLGRLGGDEARGFLEFAARNEDDPVMMEVAQDALMHLDGPASHPVADASTPSRGHR